MIHANEQVLCVQQAGATENTKIHCVGDGAPWIANQVEEKFGSNGKYLIDFYHLCEYLSAAAPYCANSDHVEKWLKTQKDALKSNQYTDVLHALRPYLENKTIEDAQAPVRACYRYINNRPNQLDELHADMIAAIAREKQIKAGSRKKKLALIESINPRWLDLFETLF